jgi:hypothetical protein
MGRAELAKGHAVFEEAPGDYGFVAGGEDFLFAGRDAVALVVLPCQALVEEDADAGLALGAPGLGLVGADQVVGTRFGGVEDRVEGFRANPIRNARAKAICSAEVAASRSMRSCELLTGTGARRSRAG